jgi:hypothetical protein
MRSLRNGGRSTSGPRSSSREIQPPMTLTLLLLFLFVGIPILAGFCMNPVPEIPDYQERDLQGLDGRDLWKELRIPRH